MKQLKILVACGSGIATSSVAVYKIENLCKEIGVDAKIVKTTIKEIPEKSAGMDLVLTTNRYQGIAECPVECVVNLLTGINSEATEKKIANILLNLAET
ncbi:MAG TPA: PTS sugar transporter subunit IIB [Candidatus Merdisoma merdipullorum]|nr:PTS sugar transporter subunit IIB [Candidatus Merdisoma merdipullorum]